MEAATLALLRAASTKTPSATSSSEYSRESSPEFHTWISPGEVNIEGYIPADRIADIEGCDPCFSATSFYYVWSLCTYIRHDLAFHFLLLFGRKAIFHVGHY